jgi:hypothetical protein
MSTSRNIGSASEVPLLVEWHREEAETRPVFRCSVRLIGAHVGFHRINRQA